MGDREYTFVVDATAGLSAVRLDAYLVSLLPELSRTAIQRLIAEGQATVNDAATRAAYHIRVGDRIRICVPAPSATELLPEAIPLDILYEDGDILVINKPAGLIVHPGAGVRSGTLVNAILAHCPDLQGIGGAIRPGIVHRLDKDTSGVLVVAKHDQAIRALQQQFKQRTVRKRYLALVSGTLTPDTGIIEAPIGRHPVHRSRMAVTHRGKPARTRWRVRGYFRDAQGHRYTFVDVRLHTGRTHQIRVHFTWLGYPLVGDRIYGASRVPLGATRQFLHACELSFMHPTTGEELTFRAPLPHDLREVLALLTAEEPLSSRDWEN